MPDDRPTSSICNLAAGLINKSILTAVIIGIVAMVVSTVQAEADAVADILRSQVALLDHNGTLSVNDESITASRVLKRIYEINHFVPLWNDVTTLSRLIEGVKNSHQDGLNPSDYHPNALESESFSASDHRLSARDKAEQDILLTDSLIRLAFHLYYGKVDPRTLHPRWKIPPYIGSKEAAILIGRHIREGRITELLDLLRPSNYRYQQLQTALHDHRKIADSGGWEPIPEGPLIEKGDRDSRVPLIRRRLIRSHDLAAGAPDSGDLFDSALEDAVARFQDRHRVPVFGPGVEDRYGAVGDETLTRMNTTVEQLIDSIRVNLERARWLLRNLPHQFIVADIAGFEVFVIEQDSIVWRARAQVGDRYRETPVFQSTIQYMEINPTWTVPTGILRDSVLPSLQKGTDPKLLKTFQVFDRSGNRIHDPEQIHWFKYSWDRLPFRLVQPPGPTNPLGRIKFIFPNPDFVFMHDTPRKEFFDNERRDMSAGCIRVERPLELASFLMRLDGKENDEALNEMVVSGKTERIHFHRPIPIILSYRTVSVDRNGDVHFLEDLYERDARVLSALDGPVVFWTIGAED